MKAIRRAAWIIKDSTIGNYRRKAQKRRYRRHIKWGMKIGENVEIFPDVEIEAHYCYLLTIGDNTTISAGCRIMCHDASTFRYLNYSKIGRVDIGKNCLIGERVIILPGTKIGDNCIISAGSVVNKEIPPNSIVVGNPARVYGRMEDYLDRHRKQYPQSPKFHHKYLVDSRFDKQAQEVVRKALDGVMGYSIGVVTNRDRDLPQSPDDTKSKDPTE